MPKVSILTRPWGRVQPTCSRRSDWRTRQQFQFSPALGGECNTLRGQGTPTLVFGFNSHPPLGASATVRAMIVRLPRRHVSILTRPWGRVQLESLLLAYAKNGWFQFSPALGGECNGDGVGGIVPHNPLVSILTRPWGRVQRKVLLLYSVPSGLFQFSPALGGECNTLPGRNNRRFRWCFNSHPPLGASATHQCL